MSHRTMQTERTVEYDQERGEGVKRATRQEEEMEMQF